MTFPLPETAFSSESKACAQFFAAGTANPLALSNLSQKFANCRSLVMVSSGGRPSISINRHRDISAKRSTNVDLPIRRRPETTTNEGDSFAQTDESNSN